MIRILVLVLAAANLLYFSWSRWVRQEAPRLVAPEVAPSAAATSASTSMSAVPTTEGACTLLGPMADETRAMEVEQLLRDMRITPLRHTVSAEVRSGWWVHVATADVTAQLRALRTIQEAGIDDAFAMPDDPEFRVSVGVFSDEARAQARAAAVRALRLEAKVTERMSRETSFWFELPGVAPASFDLSRLAAEGIDTSSLEVDACGEQAEVPLDGTGSGGGAATSSEAGASERAAV
jgi:hypothetical protein